ncbi:hemerythrin domain-containing protein [Streptomyces sp. NPDC029704]|uniref:hemerythrin domain-containing protein n=1 Tax=Streptomyces sp. NPDC029704 TaxID=3156920 RepID=UPI0033EB4E20
MDRPGDVVELLKGQHERIRELFDEVLAHTGEERRHCFRLLVHLLAVHETAEEEIVHPYAERHLEGGEPLVADRLKEEEEAKRTLKHLEGLDPDAAEFVEEFCALRAAVLTHAETEERQEFARLEQAGDAETLRLLGKAVRAAEALAPTRPHPGTESAVKNAVLGPPAAVADRTRDAVRSVFRAARPDGKV